MGMIKFSKVDSIQKYFSVPRLLILWLLKKECLNEGSGQKIKIGGSSLDRFFGVCEIAVLPLVNCSMAVFIYIK